MVGKWTVYILTGCYIHVRYIALCWKPHMFRTEGDRKLTSLFNVCVSVCVVVWLEATAAAHISPGYIAVISFTSFLLKKFSLRTIICKPSRLRTDTAFKQTAGGYTEISLKSLGGPQFNQQKNTISLFKRVTDCFLPSRGKCAMYDAWSVPQSIGE